METPTDLSWKECVVGHDCALVRILDSATMAFGLGPARGSTADPTRLMAMTDGARGKLRAVHYCRQVHGCTVHRVEEASDPISEIGAGDALVTGLKSVGVLVWTADCVPVLLAGDGVVAAVHSGWRGCAADVVGAALKQIRTRHGLTPNRLRIALGPSVCGNCYQVGPEVPQALRTFGLDETLWQRGNRVDLRGFLSARLEALGVPAEHIETVGGCTVESSELASYRRDGAEAGRQWSMVFLNP